MALFGRGGDSRSSGSDSAPAAEVHTILGKQAFCRVCNKQSQLSRCWLRTKPMTKCACCNAPLPNAAELYKKRIPACPHCGEWLEHPGFEYGLCDDCGSKYEVTEGCRPTLIPNKQQRAEMDRIGRAWSRD